MLVFLEGKVDSNGGRQRKRAAKERIRVIDDAVYPLA